MLPSSPGIALPLYHEKMLPLLYSRYHFNRIIDIYRYIVKLYIFFMEIINYYNIYFSIPILLYFFVQFYWQAHIQMLEYAS